MVTTYASNTNSVPFAVKTESETIIALITCVLDTHLSSMAAVEIVICYLVAIIYNQVCLLLSANQLTSTLICHFKK